MCNIGAAAEAGLAYGAEGYLNTDWGDYGHWQPFVVSWPGIAYGAAVSWATQANLDRDDLPEMLNEHVFKDKTERFGEALWALSNVYFTWAGRRCPTARGGSIFCGARVRRLPAVCGTV